MSDRQGRREAPLSVFWGHRFQDDSTRAAQTRQLRVTAQGIRVDMNCDGVYDVFDVVMLIDVVFHGGSAPTCP